LAVGEQGGEGDQEHLQGLRLQEAVEEPEVGVEKRQGPGEDPGPPPADLAPEQGDHHH